MQIFEEFMENLSNFNTSNLASAEACIEQWIISKIV